MDTIYPYRLTQTSTLVRWLGGLRDYRAKAAIVFQLKQVAAGHWGDVRSVGAGESELRWHSVLLLAGGYKSRLDTVLKVLQALGVQMQVHSSPIQP